ncbi:MAG: DUF2058 family protein [Pseudomonadota bacterium]
MGDSLRDQLVKAGLASKSSANTLNAKSRKKHKKRPAPNEADAKAKKRADAKRERDRALNAEVEAKKAKAALKGQIKQLIDQNAVADYRGEVTFNYVSGGKIRPLFVTQQVHDDLAADKIAITRLNGKTRLIPVAIADQVLELNPDWAVFRPGADSGGGADADDAYSGYEVPDDLTW